MPRSDQHFIQKSLQFSQIFSGEYRFFNLLMGFFFYRGILQTFISNMTRINALILNEATKNCELVSSSKQLTAVLTFAFFPLRCCRCHLVSSNTAKPVFLWATFSVQHKQNTCSPHVEFPLLRTDVSGFHSYHIVPDVIVLYILEEQ